MVFKTYNTLILFLVVGFISLFFSTEQIFAQSVDDLNEQIESYEEKIKAIDKEIEEQRKLIQTTSAKAGEIQAQINSLMQLEINSRKISAELKMLSKKVNSLLKN